MRNGLVLNRHGNAVSGAQNVSFQSFVNRKISERINRFIRRFADNGNGLVYEFGYVAEPGSPGTLSKSAPNRTPENGTSRRNRAPSEASASAVTFSKHIFFSGL
jgi:hypothetical protein